MRKLAKELEVRQIRSNLDTSNKHRLIHLLRNRLRQDDVAVPSPVRRAHEEEKARFLLGRKTSTLLRAKPSMLNRPSQRRGLVDVVGVLVRILDLCAEHCGQTRQPFSFERSVGLARMLWQQALFRLRNRSYRK